MFYFTIFALASNIMKIVYNKKQDILNSESYKGGYYRSIREPELTQEQKRILFNKLNLQYQKKDLSDYLLNPKIGIQQKKDKLYSTEEINYGIVLQNGGLLTDWDLFFH